MVVGTINYDGDAPGDTVNATTDEESYAWATVTSRVDMDADIGDGTSSADPTVDPTPSEAQTTSTTSTSSSLDDRTVVLLVLGLAGAAVVAGGGGG